MTSRPLIASLALGAALASCATTDLGPAYVAHDAGDFQRAADEAAAIEPERDHDRIWVLLERGKMLQDAGRWADSNAAFQSADELIEVLDEAAVVSTAAARNVTKALLTDDRSLDYEGTGYDRILLGAALCLNHLMLGDFETAAVYARRQASRQAEARQKYEKEIRALGEREQAARGQGAGVSVQSVENAGDYQAQSARLAAWTSPADAAYTVPYGSWLGTIAFGAASRLPEQRRMAEDLASMLPDNPHAAELALLEGVDERVFVLFENGLAPLRVDRSFFYPSPLGLTRVPVPDLQIRDAGRARALRIQAGGEALETLRIDEVDRLIATEFRGALAGIWFRNVVAVVLKEVGTKQLEDQIGGWGVLVGSVFKVTVQPDLRSWRTLPGEHQGAVIPRPEDGRLALALLGPGGAAGPARDVSLPSGPSLVLVRSTGAGNMVVYTAALADTPGPPPSPLRPDEAAEPLGPAAARAPDHLLPSDR